MKPWERRDDESEAAFAAFECWNSHSNHVQITFEFTQQLESIIGYLPTINTVRQWMARHEWQARRKAKQNWLLNKRVQREIDSIAKERSLIIKQHSRIRRLAMRKTVSTLTKLRSIEPTDAKECSVILDGVLKAMQAGGIASLDHADQLRKLSSEVGSGVVKESPEAEEVIPPIPPESGCLQYDDPEKETVLGDAAGDMPGDS